MVNNYERFHQGPIDKKIQFISTLNSSPYSAHYRGSMVQTKHPMNLCFMITTKVMENTNERYSQGSYFDQNSIYSPSPSTHHNSPFSSLTSLRLPTTVAANCVPSACSRRDFPVPGSPYSTTEHGWRPLKGRSYHMIRLGDARATFTISHCTR